MATALSTDAWGTPGPGDRIHLGYVGPAVVTKQAVLGAGDVAYSGAQVGAKTVATGAHLVHDVADATKVSAVVGAALHPRHPQRHAESTEPIENYRDDSVFTALRDEATAAATE